MSSRVILPHPSMVLSKSVTCTTYKYCTTYQCPHYLRTCRNHTIFVSRYYYKLCGVVRKVTFWLILYHSYHWLPSICTCKTSLLQNKIISWCQPLKALITAFPVLSAVCNTKLQLYIILSPSEQWNHQILAFRQTGRLLDNVRLPFFDVQLIVLFPLVPATGVIEHIS